MTPTYTHRQIGRIDRFQKYTIESGIALGFLKDKDNESQLIGAITNAEGEARSISERIMRCWNACLGFNPDAVQDTVLLLFRIETMVRDPACHEQLFLQVNELKDRLKERN